MQGLALTTEQIIETISLYSTSAQQISGVSVAPGWQVVGAFPMPTTASVRLDVLGSVSDASLVMSVRLYCVTAGFVGVVSGSMVSIASTTDVEQFSGVFSLTGARQYQVQSQVVGNAGVSYFGNLRRVAPTGP